MENLESQLKELMLDENFTSLQTLTSEEVNLMEILGVAHRELQHSNFLAWLFNPNGSHGLDDFAIKEFIKLYFRDNQFADLGRQAGLSVFEFVGLDFSDLEIKREHKNIDLILLSRKNGFCIVVENKIYSTEGRNQLRKYRDWIESEYCDFKYRIYIYLSLFEQAISEEEQEYYLQIDYQHVVKVIEQALRNRNVPDKTRFVLEQYLQTLKSMLNENEEIERIATDLYKRYQPAFDLVYKYVKSNNTTLLRNNNLIQLVKTEPSLVLLSSEKSFAYVKFRQVFLEELLPKLKEHGIVSQEYSLNGNLVFQCEFVVRPDSITFNIHLGPGEQKTRELLYQFFLRHQTFFDKVAKKKELRPQWHVLYSKEIIAKAEFQKSLEGDNIDINALIEERFRALLVNELPRMEAIFRSAVAD